MRTISNIKYFIRIVISVSLLTSCNSAKEGEASGSGDKVATDVVQLTPVQIKNAEVATGKPVTRKVNAAIKLNGVVEVSPASKVFVSNPFGGFVKSTSILPGAKVKRGEVLLTMEDPRYIEMQQDYLVAKSRLKFLEEDYRRQQELNSDKSISDKVYQQTLAEYTSQKILVKSLEEKLRLININPGALSENNISRIVKIYAPIDGYVSAFHASVGKYSNSTDALLELTDEKTLYASLIVFEKDLPFVQVGQRLKIKSSSRKNEGYNAIVHTINRSLSSERSAEVLCSFENPDKGLNPGMFISAELAVDEAEVLSVPEDAIVTWDNKRFVFVANDNQTFQMVPVETGMASDGLIEIKSDIKDKTIVTKNAYSLLMKLKSSDE